MSLILQQILLSQDNKKDRKDKDMTKRYDGDDSAFPVNGKSKRNKKEAQVGDANPNSRAAKWLKEVATKPKVSQSENEIESPVETPVEGGDSIGAILDMAFEEVGAYIAMLENTLLETYKDVELLKQRVTDVETEKISNNRIVTLEKEVDRLTQMERDFRALQNIVLSIQNTQTQFRYIGVTEPQNTPLTYTVQFEPTMLEGVMTSDDYPKPFDDQPKMVTNQMDKE